MHQNSPRPEIASLSAAARLGSKGQFAGMVEVCQKMIDATPGDLKTLSDVGNLLLNTGHLSHAQQCFDRILKFSPTNLIALSGHAHIAHAQAQHHKARALYERLENLHPNHSVIRRNALLQLEYDPEASEQERFQKAKAWGNWIASNKQRPRPPLRDPRNRVINIGYVSADLCQHTVGLMLRDIITQHNPLHFRVFTYHAGQQVDWVTTIFEHKTHYRHCCSWNDTELALSIQQDQVDILIDLSGHTAGSRLSVFALRPAPIQISWLGYFASTGLKMIDAVLLDDVSTTAKTQSYFCEQVIKLPSRLCYNPVPFTPDVAEPPHKIRRYITFGSFNNTAKLNPEVIRLWAQILHAVPDSRLILKWRTFNDKHYSESLSDQFFALGINRSRVELRGPSFHKNLLEEYADIDIALDPFPFTGGQTTCDALMMGVPVITMVQERPVSRQSASILNSCGLDQFVAIDPASYLMTVSSLAHNRNILNSYRTTLRRKLLDSRLCNAATYRSDLEDAYIKVMNQFVQKN